MQKQNKNEKLNKNVVGVACYATRGITLIALVITIIVLLILAGITINLTIGERGIITRAQQAGKNYINAQEKEEDLLNNLESEMENIINGTDTRPVAVETLKVGDYVKYDTGVKTTINPTGVATFRVLYNDETNGLQIISDKNVADVTLGGTDWQSAMTSYNNAITTLNDIEAVKYKGGLGQDARCVGSVPTVDASGRFTAKNTENVGPVKLQFTTTVEGANNMKDADTNYTANGDTSIVRDVEAMKQGNIDLMTTGEYYWLASRDVNSSSSPCVFYVRVVHADGHVYSDTLCNVYSGGSTLTRTPSLGLRPCISLKSGVKVIAGDGKEASTAYELGM